MQQTDMVADVLQLTQVVRGDDGRQTSVRYILGKQALYMPLENVRSLRFSSRPKPFISLR